MRLTPISDFSRTKPPPALDWEAALTDNERWLRMVVFARLRDQAAVDEVMQEVACAIARQSAPLKDAAKGGPWLYRVAIRQTLLFRRAAGRRRKLLSRYAERCAPDQVDESDPLNWLLADERRRLVREALGQLPGRDAEILLLKYTEDWSYRQIAERLGLSVSAVEARLHRARQRLRDRLTALEK